MAANPGPDGGWRIDDGWVACRITVRTVDYRCWIGITDCFTRTDELRGAAPNVSRCSAPCDLPCRGPGR